MDHRATYACTHALSRLAVLNLVGLLRKYVTENPFDRARSLYMPEIEAPEIVEATIKYKGRLYVANITRSS
jgi:hypothetical protein